MKGQKGETTATCVSCKILSLDSREANETAASIKRIRMEDESQ